MSLSVKNLNKSFGEKVIFKDFCLDFPDKGLYIISGESGAGKTTLLRMIGGLDTDFSGEILGGGIKNCSFAFQEYRLFPTLSALDNLIFANYNKKNEQNLTEAGAMLSSLGFSAADSLLYPDELSGGMKQRVSLARAFLRNAPILLLDEPTKELDEENANKALEIIKKEANSRLVILVTHNKRDLDFLMGEVIKI